MADKKTVSQSAVNAPKYSREELMAYAEALFLTKPEVLAGALHTSRKEEWTVDEAHALVKQFLNRKVS